MEDTEISSSRALDSAPAQGWQGRQGRVKVEIYHEILSRLKDSQNQEASHLGFDDELWAHFNRLPVRCLRPTILISTHPLIVELLERCWHQDPYLRLEFSEIIKILQHIIAMAVIDEERPGKSRKSVAEDTQMVMGEEKGFMSDTCASNSSVMLFPEVSS